MTYKKPCYEKKIYVPV